MIKKEQWLEILEKYSDGKTFVEIGAHDGESWSNSVYLADDGWKGYYYEPVEKYAKLCRERHSKNDVEVYQYAIGKPGIRPFYVSNLLSTLQDKKYQDKVSELEWFKGAEFTETKVEVRSPAELPECNVLIIDVEGSEYEILEDMTIRPKVIMVELHEDSLDWQKIINTKQSVLLLEEIGYTKVYADDVDSIFIYGI